MLVVLFLCRIHGSRCDWPRNPRRVSRAVGLFGRLRALQLLNLVLLALNLPLLLLQPRLSLRLFDFPVLHRITDQCAAEQAQTTADGRTGAGVAGERANYRAGG